MLPVDNSLNDELLFHVYYQCHSQIALAWIKPTNKEFKGFIEKRVIEIRRNTSVENWHYCKSKENTSDLITQKQIIDLIKKEIQWEGPIILKEHDIFENKDVTEIDTIEKKKVKTLFCLSGIKDKVDLNEVLNITW